MHKHKPNKHAASKQTRPSTPRLSSTKVQKHSTLTWIDVENPSREDLAKFAGDYGLHDLQVEECLSKRQLPHIEIERGYVFLLLYFPNYDTLRNKITSSHVGIFLGKDYLLSIHEDSAPGMRSLFTHYEQTAANGTTHKSPAYLLYSIITNQLGDLSRLIQTVSQDLNDIDDQVFDTKASDAYVIGQLRQKIMRLRRMTAALRDMLPDVSDSIQQFTGENLTRYYDNNTKIAHKLWETVEEARETVEIYKDADFTTSTEKTNDILAVLTLIFTLTIPATIFGTFYGMNVLLPGGIATGNWAFLGPYTMLKLIVLASLVAGIAMYAFFKKKQWL